MAGARSSSAPGAVPSAVQPEPDRPRLGSCGIWAVRFLLDVIVSARGSPDRSAGRADIDVMKTISTVPAMRSASVADVPRRDVKDVDAGLSLRSSRQVLRAAGAGPAEGQAAGAVRQAHPATGDRALAVGRYGQHRGAFMTSAMGRFARRTSGRRTSSSRWVCGQQQGVAVRRPAATYAPTRSSARLLLRQSTWSSEPGSQLFANSWSGSVGLLADSSMMIRIGARRIRAAATADGEWKVTPSASRAPVALIERGRLSCVRLDIGTEVERFRRAGASRRSAHPGTGHDAACHSVEQRRIPATRSSDRLRAMSSQPAAATGGCSS